MRVRILLLVLAQFVVGEKTWLKNFGVFPPPGSLQTVGFFFVDEQDVPQIRLKGPIIVRNEAAVPLRGLQLSLIPHEYLKDLKVGSVEPSEGSASRSSAQGDAPGETNELKTLCCTRAEAESGVCEMGGLNIPGALSWDVTSKTLQFGFAGKIFSPSVYSNAGSGSHVNPVRYFPRLLCRSCKCRMARMFRGRDSHGPKFRARARIWRS